jgi:hypothetical protein
MLMINEARTLLKLAVSRVGHMSMSDTDTTPTLKLHLIILFFKIITGEMTC